ncbi:hypothetical protein [Alteribacillus sp. YIM 98480]|uniref:hypothetical protein n=1 Tax=Alteribacillus sp. YIM 98480 TaxID=2606599 RepID=UPI00131E8184|nr:hypothetical protein [Alteribacillus sp. YIM 98480]
MAVNIIFGFIIPWICGILLFKDDKNIIKKVVPFVSFLSVLINVAGNKYWLVKPRVNKWQFLTTFPQNFGYFPILGCIFISTLYKKYTFTDIWVILFAIFSTAVEYAMVVIRKVEYSKGWTIVHTFFIYVLSLWLLKNYYIWVKNGS